MAYDLLFFIVVHMSCFSEVEKTIKMNGNIMQNGLNSFNKCICRCFHGILFLC